MTPKEIFESGAGQFMRADQFEEAGITLVDNTPEEIKAVVLEMAQIMSGPPINFLQWKKEFVPPYFHHRAWEDWLKQQGSEQYFWESFPRSISPYTKAPLHGEFRMRIGSEFLRSYQ